MALPRESSTPSAPDAAAPPPQPEDGTPSWRAVATAGLAPADRSATAAAFHHPSGRWYHFGGLGERRYGDLWALDLSRGVEDARWELVAPAAAKPSGGPQPRSKASLTVIPGGGDASGTDGLLLFGGWAGGKLDKLDDMWLWSFAPPAPGSDQGKWRRVVQSGAVPAARSAHAVTLLPSSCRSPPSSVARVLLFGGIGANKYGDAFIGTISRAHDRGVSCHWRAVGSLNANLPPRSSYGSLHIVPVAPPTPADGADGTTAARASVLLFGGLTCGQLNDVIAAPLSALSDVTPKSGSSSLSGDGGFRSLRPTAPSALAPFKRGRHATAVVDGPCGSSCPLLLVHGGTDLRNHDPAVHVFDVGQHRWLRSVKAAKSPPAMESHSMVVVPSAADPAGIMVVFGGWRGGGSADGWVPGAFALPLSPVLAAATADITTA